jgi:hypothetical protein
MATPTIQTMLARHISEYAATLGSDPDLADKLVLELSGSEHVGSLQVTRIASCAKMDVLGWDDEPLLSVCVTPRRASVCTQTQREEWQTRPQRFADEMGRNLAIMNGA